MMKILQCRPNFVAEGSVDASLCSWFTQLSGLNVLLKALYSIDDDTCSPSCQETKYSIRIASSMSVNKLMQILKTDGGMTRTKLHNYLFSNKTGGALLNLVQFETDPEVVMERRFSKLAVVEVGFGTSDYKLITRDVKATFFDKLSLIGGTLGLYTGFSVVSLIEIVFWLGKWSHERRKKQ